MIDSDNFSKRLKIIMQNNEISAAQFAEILNVPRSSISHLLSGRNKPSLEFVLKVLKNFAGVELYWLLNGDGTYLKPDKNKPDAPTLFKQESKPQKPIKISESIQNTNQFKNARSNNEIDRIVIFFKDGSFKSYSS